MATHRFKGNYFISYHIDCPLTPARSILTPLPYLNVLRGSAKFVGWVIDTQDSITLLGLHLKFQRPKHWLKVTKGVTLIGYQSPSSWVYELLHDQMIYLQMLKEGTDAANSNRRHVPYYCAKAACMGHRIRQKISRGGPEIWYRELATRYSYSRLLYALLLTNSGSC